MGDLVVVDGGTCTGGRAPGCGIDIGDLDNNFRAADDLADLNRTSAWAKFAPKLKKGLQIAGTVLEVAGLALDLTTIWVTYANVDSPYDYERDSALVFATVMTVILVTVAVLGALLAPLGFAFLVFDLLFLLADLIGLTFGQSVNTRDMFLAGLISSFWSVNATTRMRDFEYDYLDMEPSGPFVVGNHLLLKDHFKGVIQAVDSHGGQLAHGDSFGDFGVNPNSSDAFTIDVYTSDSECSDEPEAYIDYAASIIYPNSQICDNSMEAVIHFDEPAINAVASVRHRAIFNTRYRECIFGYSCSSHTEQVFLPDELPAEDRWDYIDLTLDILPATISGLWHWDELTALDANDADADGLSYYDETELFATDPNDWDSDGDLLSDAFEVHSDLQPYSADYDQDGLNDNIELRIGTSITDEDSDNDGLLDGEEFSYYDASGTWVPGGWFVEIDGGNFFVFASPFTNDLDQDGVNDGSETGGTGRMGGATASSPHATNHLVPDVILSASPLHLAPDGRVGVFAKQGDVVSATLTIDNPAVAAVDDIVELCLPDAGWSNTSVEVSGLNADNLPDTVVNGDCYQWDFSTKPLYQFFDFEAVFTGEVGATGDVTGSISAEIPYVNVDGVRVIEESIPLTIDNTVPNALITEPIPNTRLAGDYFVMGGIAQDDLSWVDHVKVTVPAGTYTATGSSPWAYTWELPDDGIVTVSAVAYDVVGNASAPFDVQVTVDSLTPTITTDFADGATLAAGESYSDTITLSGMVSDNYAGVVHVQMAYNNQPWRTIWSSATPETGPIPWSGVWKLPSLTASAQGEHTLRVRATDDFGNVGTLEQTVFVDLLPPTSELTDRRFSADTIAHVPLSQPLTLQGVANDAGRNPIASGPIALEGTLDVIDDATVWLQPDTYEVDDAGVTVAWIGDYNGDRLGDMAIGFPNSSGGRGKVVVVTGRAGDWPNPNIGEMEQLYGQAPTFFGVDGAGLGATIVPAGDFNGDGFEEFLLGDLANNRLFMVYGTPGYRGSNVVLEDTSISNWDEIALLSQGAENFTTQFASAGDVNNDSYNDILIATDTAVYLLVGGQSATTSDIKSLAAASLTVGNASVAGVGDVTGDLIDDFAIATGGTVYLFSGSNGGWISGWRQ